MSISSIGSAANTLHAQTGKVASDGASAAAESRETAAGKRAENLNGGVTPKASAASAATAAAATAATGKSAGLLNTVA